MNKNIGKDTVCYTINRAFPDDDINAVVTVSYYLQNEILVSINVIECASVSSDLRLS